MVATATQDIEQTAPPVAAAPPPASSIRTPAAAAPPPASSIRKPDAEAQMRDGKIEQGNEHDQATLRQRAHEEAAAKVREEQGRDINPDETALVDDSIDATQRAADKIPGSENLGMGIFTSIIMQVFGLGQSNGNSLEGLNIESIIGGFFSSMLGGVNIPGLGEEHHDHDGHDHSGGPAIGGDPSYDGGSGTVSLSHPLENYTGGAGDNIGWNQRRGRVHEGRDYGSPRGTDIHAAAEGKVIAAGKANGYGNYVDIQHPGGIITRYAHMPNGGTNVSVGDKVTPDTVIGQVGSTGRSSAPHLHFEVALQTSDGKWKIVDPEKAMSAGSSINDPAKRAELLSDGRELYAHRSDGQGLNMAPTSA